MADSVKTSKHLSLIKALQTGRLQSFIEQEEARGIGPADPAELDRGFASVIKAPKSEDQTSRSA